MGNISLTNVAITFVTIALFFGVFFINYDIAEINGYDTSQVDNSSLAAVMNTTKTKEYIDDISELQELTQADLGVSDIIGMLITVALAPVRTVIGGANFLISNVGVLINIILPGSSIFSDYITGVFSIIIGMIFLFAAVLGRRDKND